MDYHADSRLAMTECPPIWTRTLRLAQGSFSGSGILGCCRVAERSRSTLLCHANGDRPLETQLAMNIDRFIAVVACAATVVCSIIAVLTYLFR